MSWNPKEAKEVLDRSHKVIFVRSVKKIAGYKFKSGRELVLSIENLTQVTLYVSRIPYNMIDVDITTDSLSFKMSAKGFTKVWDSISSEAL